LEKIMTLSEIEQQFTILYEDNHIVVVVKPRNIPSQADKTGDLDLLSLIREYIRLKYDKPGNVYVGLVHRLDRPTGGAMVFAKTDKAAARLCEQIRNGEIQKKYFAITVGTPREKQGRIQSYLVKDERNNMVKAYPAAVANGKLAVLDYKVLDTGEGLSLVDINLLTGRSHQARVQLAGLGTPIYGDHKYGARQITNYKLQITNADKIRESGVGVDLQIDPNPSVAGDSYGIQIPVVYKNNHQIINKAKNDGEESGVTDELGVRNEELETTDITDVAENTITIAPADSLPEPPAGSVDANIAKKKAERRQLIHEGLRTAAAGTFLCLWAYTLSFTHPTTKNAMVFKVFPPAEETPWQLFPIEKFMNIVKPTNS